MKLAFREPTFKADIVRVKAINKYPVPKNHELLEFLEILPDYHPYKLAMALIAIQGMRPKEVAGLTWEGIIMNEEKSQVKRIKHLVYKPANRHFHGKLSSLYKEVEKPCFSKWLSDQIIGYAQRYPKYPFNKIFSFTTPDVFHKFFSKIRRDEKKLAAAGREKFPFVLDWNVWTVKGQDKTLYRVSPYSFRRFAFTYHYYVTFEQDVVSLAKSFGHTKTETTYDHYLFPKEAIGLTDQMIKDKIPMDAFIGFMKADNTLLETFQAELKPEVMILKAPGQRTIRDYALESYISGKSAAEC